MRDEMADGPKRRPTPESSADHPPGAEPTRPDRGPPRGAGARHAAPRRGVLTYRSPSRRRSMLKATRRTLTAAAVIAAAGVGVNPSSASAAIHASVGPHVTAVAYCHPHAGRCIWPPSVQAGPTSVGACHRHAGRCIAPTGDQAGLTSVGPCQRHAGRCIAPTSGQAGLTSVGPCHRHAGRCTAPANAHIATSVQSPLATAATSQIGFQWGDAGIGAAAAFLLLSAAGAATIAARRHHHQRATST
jgi:hypothetical protein